MISYLVFGLTYGITAGVQPGPFQKYLISQTLKVGWRRTFPATLAPIISDLPIAFLVLLVLKQVSSSLQVVLHFLGGIFLLYLAFGTFKSWTEFDGTKMTTETSIQEGVWKTALVNFLNPSPYLGWSFVMGPLFLKGWVESPFFSFLLVFGFYGSMIIVSLLVMMLFSAAGNIGPRVNKSLIATSVLGLVCFAVYQFWLGFQAL